MSGNRIARVLCFSWFPGSSLGMPIIRALPGHPPATMPCFSTGGGACRHAFPKLEPGKKEEEQARSAVPPISSSDPVTSSFLDASSNRRRDRSYQFGSATASRTGPIL